MQLYQLIKSDSFLALLSIYLVSKIKICMAPIITGDQSLIPWCAKHSLLSQAYIVLTEYYQLMSFELIIVDWLLIFSDI